MVWMRGFLSIFALVNFLALSFAPVFAGPTGPIRVIDGDTFDIGGARVRLHGIDAPEQDQTCTTPSGEGWACGAWVTRQVAARYQGRTAFCEQLDTDRYDRIVARCSVDGQDIGQTLVGEGLALAYRRYSMAYDLDEKAAAVNRRGLHAGQFEQPATFRQGNPAPQGAAAHNCRIKGNISKGGRIYHLPHQRDYNRTRITTAKGERWFCSTDEARAAGWRAARR